MIAVCSLRTAAVRGFPRTAALPPRPRPLPLLLRPSAAGSQLLLRPFNSALPQSPRLASLSTRLNARLGVGEAIVRPGRPRSAPSHDAFIGRRYLSGEAGVSKKTVAAPKSTGEVVKGGDASPGAGAGGGGGGGGNGAGQGSSGWFGTRVRIFARMVKIARIPALILGIYGLGYQQGIIDYSRDPALKQDDLLVSILGSVGCHDRSLVETARDGDWRNKFLGNAHMQRVALVGEKIVKAAKKYVDDQLGRVMAKRMKHLSQRDREDEDRLLRLLMTDEECAFWATAKKRMDGQWRYILIGTDVANAFVSEILPQRIFVTTAMVDTFIENDDEMALVLGHEVSHLILGHVSDKNTLSTILRTVEILLLSIDPSEGLLSLGVMSLLATLRHSLVAANSRDNETQADELGIKLAAMACYDTKRATEVFRKMHLHRTESGADESEAKESGRSLLSFIDTHPPSDERHEFLLRASEEENPEKYEEEHCGSIRKMFKDMLRESHSALRYKARDAGVPEDAPA